MDYDDLFDASLIADENGVLNLQNNHWVTLDDIVWTYADALLVLNVSHNQLVQISESVGNLKLLRELLLANNRIEIIPVQIARCVNLRKLDLHRNRLKELPSELQYCERLEDLNVAFNHLTMIPPELGRLQRLRVLNVGYNKLTQLPHTLCDCPLLEQVDCEGNKGLNDIPEELRSNTKMVLWICNTVKEHHAEVSKLIEINSELKRMAQLRDEERRQLCTQIADLKCKKEALEGERPHNYLLVKKHAMRVTSEVCNLM